MLRFYDDDDHVQYTSMGQKTLLSQEIREFCGKIDKSNDSSWAWWWWPFMNDDDHGDHQTTVCWLRLPQRHTHTRLLCAKIIFKKRDGIWIVVFHCFFLQRPIGLLFKSSIEEEWKTRKSNNRALKTTSTTSKAVTHICNKTDVRLFLCMRVIALCQNALLRAAASWRCQKDCNHKSSGRRAD